MEHPQEPANLTFVHLPPRPMATLSATVSFFVLLLFSIVFLVADAGGDVKKVCAKTPYPEFCESSINAHPESKDAEDDQEVVYWAVNSGYIFADNAAHAANTSTEPCAAACEKNFEWASTDFTRAVNEYPDYDIMMKVVRNFLDEAKKKKVEWNCDKCIGKSVKNAVYVAKGNDLEKWIEVMSALADPK